MIEINIGALVVLLGIPQAPAVSSQMTPVPVFPT